ncbi:class I SAM-dependent methyltransferase [Jatrophihabitans fulvus]
MTQPSDANRLAAEYLARGDATGWFDALYREAADGTARVPWDRGAPNPWLVEWAAGRAAAGSAVVVGCGPGHDAEHLARLGWRTTAFDVSPSVVEQVRAARPGTTVDYVVADLFDLPATWGDGFDLVVENMTVQSLPPDLHAAATDAVASLVAPGGTLLVLGPVAVPGDDEGPPWPLRADEIDRFAAGVLEEVRREVLDVDCDRWRVELRRP